MLKKCLLNMAGLCALACYFAAPVAAEYPYTFTHRWAGQAAATYPWHGPYYHQQYQAPVALVVPPTAHMRQTYSWGVSQNLSYPIHHQFRTGTPSPGYGGLNGFRPTPHWPSHTDQFGIYYVRGPW
jgi:hypothetical protein